MWEIHVYSIEMSSFLPAPAGRQPWMLRRNVEIWRDLWNKLRVLRDCEDPGERVENFHFIPQCVVLLHIRHCSGYWGKAVRPFQLSCGLHDSSKGMFPFISLWWPSMTQEAPVQVTFNGLGFILLWWIWVSSPCWMWIFCVQDMLYMYLLISLEHFQRSVATWATTVTLRKSFLLLCVIMYWQIGL